MRLLLLALQVASWVAVSLAAFRKPCGIPFSMANYTRQMIDNPDVEPVMDPTALGAAFLLEDHETGPGMFLWPRSKSTKFANIPYCYYNKDVRDNLHTMVEQAISTWYDVLGGPPSQGAGHGINFKERMNGCGDPLYCTGADGKNWNSDIPHKTFTIRKSTSDYYSSTVGFFRSDPSQPWDTELNLPYPNPVLTEVIHELGHIMGLIHEHQRADRDNYVIYRCEKIEELDEVWHDALEEEPTITKQDLCTKINKAISYDFIGGEFMTFPREPGGRKGWTKGDPYDYSSIMGYPTVQDDSRYTTEDCEYGFLSECAILKKRFPGDQVGEPIPHARVPSMQDVEFVKYLYPYISPHAETTTTAAAAAKRTMGARGRG